MIRTRARLLTSLATVLGLAAACGAPLAAAAPAARSIPKHFAAAPPPRAAIPTSIAPHQPTRRVRVWLDGAVTLERVLEAGLDVISSHPPLWVEVLEWPGDAATLARLGARHEVVEHDVEGNAARRAARELAARGAPAPARVWSANGADGAWRAVSLPPVGSGSMGGYWTLAEVKTKLDSIVANDPWDVVADQLDTLGWTIQQRPIWGLRLRGTAGPPGPRPIVYFSALTHAREPAGMQALLWFVDDVISKYPDDPWARTLLERREIHVIPVVNPDGYALNEALYPGGGGLHRKNVRDNDSDAVVDYGTDGVDLNRNYPYRWGWNNVGSSATASNQAYRGPAAASEPETQTQIDWVSLIAPWTGLSFHTYSDLLLHPWGWTPAAVPDSAAFQEWSDVMSLGSGYATGPSPRILYEVNGEFNDWVYGDTLAKPRGFTWTPEAGNPDDGFWPPPSRIVPICEENLRACWIAASIAGSWVRVESFTLEPDFLPAGHVRELTVRARNLGLAQTGGAVTGTLTPLDDGLEVFPSGPVTWPMIPSLTSVDPGAVFTIAAADTVTPGRRLRLRVDFVTEDGEFSRDTLELVAGVPTVVLNENAETPYAWSVSGSWGIVTGDPDHPSHYFADSPLGTYSAGGGATATLVTPLDLSAGVHAWLELESRWAFESDYDAGLIEASLDGVAWTPLAGRGTSRGVAFAGGMQPDGEPVYDGVRWRWAPERLDLSAFSGPAATTVQLRARILADGSVQLDGFALDSIRVLVYDPLQQPAPTAVEDGVVARLELAPPAPNPARARTRFAWTLPRGGATRLEVLDPAGRRVRTLLDRALEPGRYQLGWDLRDDAGRRVPAGIYLARLGAPDGAVTRRFAVIP